MTYQELIDLIPSYGHRESITPALAERFVTNADERIRGDFWGELTPYMTSADDLPSTDPLYISAAMVELRKWESDAEGQMQWDASYQGNLGPARSLRAAIPGRAPQVVR